jgi:hypothetical protein
VRFLLACQPRNCYLLPVNGFAISLPAEGGGTTQGVTEGVAEIARHALVLKRVLNCKFRVLLHRFAEPPRGGSLWHKNILRLIFVCPLLIGKSYIKPHHYGGVFVSQQEMAGDKPPPYDYLILFICMGVFILCFSLRRELCRTP